MIDISKERAHLMLLNESDIHRHIARWAPLQRINGFDANILRLVRIDLTKIPPNFRVILSTKLAYARNEKKNNNLNNRNSPSLKGNDRW